MSLVIDVRIIRRDGGNGSTDIAICSSSFAKRRTWSAPCARFSLVFAFLSDRSSRISIGDETMMNYTRIANLWPSLGKEEARKRLEHILRGSAADPKGRFPGVRRPFRQGCAINCQALGQLWLAGIAFHRPLFPGDAGWGLGAASSRQRRELTNIPKNGVQIATNGKSRRLCPIIY